MTKYLWLGICLTLFLSATETVENSQTPEGKTVTIQFKENLRLSADSGEDYHTWTGATVTMDVNNQGHMFVVDTGGNRILEFAPDGTFVRQIGKKGQGPGEFQFLKGFRIFKDKEGALAFDDMSNHALFSTYDKDMNYVDRKQHQPAGSIESLTFSPNGDYMGAFYMTYDPQKGTKTHTAVFDKDFKPVIDLTTKKAPNFDPNKLSDPNWWSDFYGSWFNLVATGLGISAFDNQGNVYTCNTNEYIITKRNSKLEETLIIKRNYKPIIQTDEDLLAFSDPIRSEIISSLPASLHPFITPQVVKNAIEKAEFPARKQPIFGLIPMEDGHLLVVHNFNPQTGESFADIINKDGKFVGTTKLPRVSVNFFGSFFGDPVKMMFHKGQAYAIEINDDDEPSLVRYNVAVN